jgi:MFS family permease
MASSTPDPRRWWALAIIAVAQFVVIMDTSIIGVALPEIQRALQFSQPDLSWVFNAYVIAFGGLLLLGGRLADLYGARRVFMAGFAILGGASLITGLAPSDSVLLAGRALQGAGSALIAPAALTMLMTLFSHDPRELTKALALYGAAAPAGGTAGVFLGGVLTASLDWRWVFLVNVPVALVVLVASRRILPAGFRRSGRLDIRGAVAVTAALSLAVFGIVRGPIVGWAATETIGALVAAAAFFAIFVRLQSRDREPLMRLGIWRAPNLAAANLSMALLGAAWIPTWFFLNLYLQQVLGFGAFEAGLALVPMTLTIMVLMVAVTGRVVARFGFKRPVIAGLVILAAGITWLSLASGDARRGDRDVARVHPRDAGRPRRRSARGRRPRRRHRQHDVPGRIGSRARGRHGRRHRQWVRRGSGCRVRRNVHRRRGGRPRRGCRGCPCASWTGPRARR